MVAQQIFYKGTKAIQKGKKSLYNKWCWTTRHQHTKEWSCTPPYTIHKNPLKMGHSKCKSWNHKLATLWTIAHQAPQSMGFSRQEYWSGLPFPSPGDLPDPGIKPRSPALQADALTSSHQGSPLRRKHRSKSSGPWVRQQLFRFTKNKVTKRKIKLAIIKIKNICAAKWKLHRVEKIFVNHISDKGLVSRIHEELSQFSNKRLINRKLSE